MTSDFDILITSYEMCLREKSVLQRYAWEYIIIDEAHRIKNVDSLLSQIVRSFSSRGRLLITGTPLQNNLQELWALLNFILPGKPNSQDESTTWAATETSPLFHLQTSSRQAKTLMPGSRAKENPMSSNSRSSASCTRSCAPSCFDVSSPRWSIPCSRKRRSTCTSECLTCKRDGTRACWRRISMRSTVS